MEEDDCSPEILPCDADDRKLSELFDDDEEVLEEDEHPSLLVEVADEEHVYGHVLKGAQQFLLDEMAINLATEGVNTFGVVEDVKKQVRALQKQALERPEKLVACVRSVLVEEKDGIRSLADVLGER